MMMVEMLVKMPDLRRRIQTDHVADGTGHCRDCAGAQWPCELYRMATEADRRCGIHHPAALTPRYEGPAGASRFPEPRRPAPRVRATPVSAARAVRGSHPDAPPSQPGRAPVAPYSTGQFDRAVPAYPIGRFDRQEPARPVGPLDGPAQPNDWTNRPVPAYSTGRLDRLVPTQTRPGALPPQRRVGLEPAMPGSGPVGIPEPTGSYRRTAGPAELALDEPAPKILEAGQPRHLIGLLPQPAAPKQELIDVLEDVLRWSR
jgi:hypothetical protein